MARITVEDCLVQENNRFALVQLASKRTKQLLSGSRTLTTEAKGNKAVVTALREIAGGFVRFMTPEDEEKIRLQAEAEAAIRGEATASSFADDLFEIPVASDDDDEDDDSEDGEPKAKGSTPTSEEDA
jgi:DNA-directed RNA polymerase subunit omega